MTKREANVPINDDLEAQKRLAGQLAARVADNFAANFMGDESVKVPEDLSEVFDRTVAFYDETKERIAAIEAKHKAEDQPIGTAQQLHSYLDSLSGQGEEKPGLNHFSATMGSLLVKRLEGAPDGVVPMGYIMATQLLRHDCEVTGKDGYTGEPLPESILGKPSGIYGLFQFQSIGFANEAFGKEFGDQVKEIYVSLLGEAKDTDTEAYRQQEQIFNFMTEKQANTHGAIGKEEAYEVLKKVPGIDPVLAVVDGHPEDIPSEGWLINSHIAPGYGGVIRLYRYGEGSLKDKGASDTREKYGEARVHFDLKRDYASHTVAYENPNFAQKDVEPFDRGLQTSYTGLGFRNTDIIELENGGRILDELSPMKMGRGGGMFFSMDWKDIDKIAGYDGDEVDINRVVTERKDLDAIIGRLAYAMGMDEQGIGALRKAVETKSADV